LKDTKTNKDLLILLREGDMVAFDAIYNRYCKRLYVFVLGYIKQELDAEGIVQEVFIKIWEAREKIDIYASFESFLFTIAYNSTITLLRKRVNETKYLDHLKARQQVNSAVDIIEEIHFNELNEKVKLLLNKLTPRQKEIFQLSREEGFTHGEIAKKLNVSVNTVNNHLVSALSFLKSNIDSDLIINLLFVSLFF
jgi:RNA polymerase sigma-70 factor (ECF subfamily)